MILSPRSSSYGRLCGNGSPDDFVAAWMVGPYEGRCKLLIEGPTADPLIELFMELRRGRKRAVILPATHRRALMLRQTGPQIAAPLSHRDALPQVQFRPSSPRLFAS